MELPTLKIKHPDGFAIINEADFIEGKDELFEEAPALPTREDIAKMKKADIEDWLKAHGVEKPEGTVEEQRAALLAAMFVEA